MTILLEDRQFSREQKHIIAEQVLNINHLHAEQVGFIDIQNKKLDMAGGEFCINATRAFALILAEYAGTENNTLPWEATVQASGCHTPLSLEILHGQHGLSGAKNVQVYLPFEQFPSMQLLENGVVLVHMEGIKHLLIDENIYPFTAKHWKEAALHMRQKFQLEEENALGCIWWNLLDKKQNILHNEADNVIQLLAHPVVRIATPLTECYENACGSGSLALAFWLHHQSGNNHFCVHQPGGHLTVNIVKNTNIVACVGGSVSLVAKGQAFFQDF